MKKLILIAAAFAALTACTKAETANVNETSGGTSFEKGQTVMLTVSTSGQTKVTSAADATTGAVNFKWEEGEKILVKVGGATAEFTLKTGAGDASATFEGAMPESGGCFDVQYPVADPVLSSQRCVSNGLPKDKMKMSAIGCTLGNSFTLTPEYAALRLNLWGGKTVGSIKVTEIDSTDPSFTLNCGTGAVLGATKTDSTAFFIVVPSGSYKFSAEIFDNAATPASICKFETTAAQNFEAGKILDMPAKEVKKSVLLPEGALSGVFSVSDTTKVNFSRQSEPVRGLGLHDRRRKHLAHADQG